MSGRPIALVTGGTGFIGRALVDALVENGYLVRVIGRRPVVRWRGNPAVEHVRADIADPGVIEAALENSAEVYHLAAAT
jgi:nucleoside-diphosphate-sugar epimerase